jgi:hypothetical protein
MPTRTVKFIGHAHSPSGSLNLTFDFDGQRIFDGPIASTTDSILNETQRNELFSFELDTSVMGNNPLALTVTGGSLGFVSLHGNYVGYTLFNDTDANQVRVDKDLTQVFSDLNWNTISNDGRTNMMLDGESVDRIIVDPASAYGDWRWLIHDGSTFTCDFVISRLLDEIPADLESVVATIPEWTIIREYPAGSLACHNGKYYQANSQHVTQGIDITDATYWRQNEVIFPIK